MPVGPARGPTPKRNVKHMNASVQTQARRRFLAQEGGANAEMVPNIEKPVCHAKLPPYPPICPSPGEGWLKDEESFRSLPRLRRRKDVDDCWIAVTRCIRSRDHLYYHGPGVLGVYYQRGTRRGATEARQWWSVRCGGVLTGADAGLAGDFAGIVLFRPQNLDDIPRRFFKGNQGNVANLRRPSPGYAIPTLKNPCLLATSETVGVQTPPDH